MATKTSKVTAAEARKEIKRREGGKGSDGWEDRPRNAVLSLLTEALTEIATSKAKPAGKAKPKAAPVLTPIEATPSEIAIEVAIEEFNAALDEIEAAAAKRFPPLAEMTDGQLRAVAWAYRGVVKSQGGKLSYPAACERFGTTTAAAAKAVTAA